MKITAEDLVGFGVCDDVIPEPIGGAHKNPSLAAEAISAYLRKTIPNLIAKPLDNLLETRYIKFRKIGEFQEGSPPETD